MIPSFPAVRRAAQAWWGPLILIGLVFWMLHRCLLSGGRLLPAFENTDLHAEFLGWRYFGFRELLTGHIPFWNPHEFCGVPFFAQIQSCMLYPIAWINLFCETTTAATFEIAMNVAIAALGAYAWARQRNISRTGATLAGAAFAFSGPVYIRVIAGHMTPLAAIAWIPLIFLSVDRILAARFASGILIGAIALALQWFAGHPQTLYYTALVAGIYTLVHTIGQKRWIAIFVSLAAMYVIGTLIAAIQVIPAIYASEFSLRSGGMNYEFAGSFSFPLENLLTYLIPYPLGDNYHGPYVGRWYIWEVSGYVGVLTLMLACIALIQKKFRASWRILVVLGITCIFMMGAYTPLFPFLWRYLPGFSSFRGTAKFSILFGLLIAIQAGEGLDWIRFKRLPRFAIATAILAIIAFAAGAIFLLYPTSTGPTARLMAMVLRSGQYYIKPTYLRGTWYTLLSRQAGYQCFIAGGLLSLLALRLVIQKWGSLTIYIIFALAVGDVYFAAWESSLTGPAQIEYRAKWMQAGNLAIAADQRVLFLDSVKYGNSGNLLGVNSVWGYDPAEPALLSSLMAAAQHQRLVPGDQYAANFSHHSQVFQLLRCRYVMQWPEPEVYVIPRPMPHVALMGNYVRMNSTSDIEKALIKNFDFYDSVILQSDPNPLPTSLGGKGQVRLVSQTINDLEIVADLPAPALLLITDLYAPGWHVRVLEDNPNQSHYDILPGDEVLRVIPLAEGYHHFDVYYIPPGLWGGMSLSVLGIVLLIAAAILLRSRRSRGII